MPHPSTAVKAELWNREGAILARDGRVLSPMLIRFARIDRSGPVEFVCIVQGTEVTSHARLKPATPERYVRAGNAAEVEFDRPQRFEARP